MNVEVFRFQVKDLPQRLNLLGLPHERDAQPLNLVRGEPPGVHAPDRLPFQQLVKQFDEGQHQLHETVLPVVRLKMRTVTGRLEGIRDP